MFLTSITPDAQTEQRRSETRLSVSASVALRPFGAGGAEARLLNISSRGFMAETDSASAKGSRVWLTLPDGNRVSALVIWSKDGRLGGQFSDPIDPLAVFQALGRQASPGANPFLNVAPAPSSRSAESPKPSA
jgi:hypothetical protein